MWTARLHDCGCCLRPGSSERRCQKKKTENTLTVVCTYRIQVKQIQTCMLMNQIVVSFHTIHSCLPILVCWSPTLEVENIISTLQVFFQNIKINKKTKINFESCHNTLHTQLTLICRICKPSVNISPQPWSVKDSTCFAIWEGMAYVETLPSCSYPIRRRPIKLLGGRITFVSGVLLLFVVR